MSINLVLIISTVIVCILFIYVHCYNKRLYIEEKYEIDYLISTLPLLDMEEYRILFLSYNNYYFKPIDKLLETINEKHIVILTAPIWLYNRKIKSWSNHVVINSTNIKPHISHIKKYEYIHYKKKDRTFFKNNNAYFSLICSNKE